MSDKKKSVTAAGRFDAPSMVLHWLTVLLIVVQFTTAWLLTPGHENPALLALHRSTGVLTWLVAAGRLIWRNGFAHLPPFPASMPKIQRRAAKLNEYGLYALLLVQPLTGLGATLSRGRPFQLFAWQIPPLLPPDDARAHALLRVHDFGASALLALIGLHAAAALLHGLFLRDGVLQRMLPELSR